MLFDAFGKLSTDRQLETQTKYNIGRQAHIHDNMHDGVHCTVKIN